MTELPRWAWMWLLAGAIYAGCKWLTWRRALAADVPWWRHAGYLLAWPGLDARAFLHSAASRPLLREWAFALAKALLGVIIFWGAARLLADVSDYALGWAGMVGVVFMLHFGLFHLLSCAWRAAGVDARPLMHHPWAATGVGEFWGRRWNTAFRDLTHRFLFRPLAPALGPTGAVAAGFAASGLVHDLVISVPAGGGYGGPTLFFLLQVPALLLERSRLGRSLGLGRGVRGWAFTMLVLLAPAPLLFHAPFVDGVVVPFMRALGAA